MGNEPVDLDTLRNVDPQQALDEEEKLASLAREQKKLEQEKLEREKIQREKIAEQGNQIVNTVGEPAPDTRGDVKVTNPVDHVGPVLEESVEESGVYTDKIKKLIKNSGNTNELIERYKSLKSKGEPGSNKEMYDKLVALSKPKKKQEISDEPLDITIAEKVDEKVEEARQIVGELGSEMKEVAIPFIGQTITDRDLNDWIWNGEAWVRYFGIQDRYSSGAGAPGTGGAGEANPPVGRDNPFTGRPWNR